MKKNSKTKIARIYSNALYDAAVDNKCVEKVWADVGKLKALIDENKEFADYMTNPLWSDDDKVDVLNKSAKALGLSSDTLNCLQVIVENRRMSELGFILDNFGKLYYAKNNIAEVLVETVKKLSSSQASRLQKTLEKVLGKKVVIDYQISPVILGGLRIRCGSKMVDGSLMSKLNYLENIMKGK